MEDALWFAFLVLYLLASAVLSVYAVWWLVVAASTRPARGAEPRVEALDHAPFVTIQIAVCGEGDIVTEAIERLGRVKYPRDRFEVQVCDDSADARTRAATSAAVARLRARGVSATRLARGDRAGLKAGNLNHALAHARGELIVVVDADFLVDPALLEQAAPLFAADPKLAAVQTYFAHLNANANLLTRSVQEGFDFYLLGLSLARSSAERWLEFNGSVGVWRKDAIVACGGWPIGTGTEDILLSYLAQLAGWRIAFTTRTTSLGRLPETTSAARRQWSRWARSAALILRRLAVPMLRSRAPWLTKLSGLFHLAAFAQHAAMAIFMLATWPALLALSARPSLAWIAWVGPASAALHIASGSVLGAQANRALGRRRRELGWSGILLMFQPAGLAVTTGLAFIGGLFGPSLRSWTPSHTAAASRFRAEALVELLAIATSVGAITLALTTGPLVMALPVVIYAFWTAAFLTGPLWLERTAGLVGRLPPPSFTERVSAALRAGPRDDRGDLAEDEPGLGADGAAR